MLQTLPEDGTCFIMYLDLSVGGGGGGGASSWMLRLYHLYECLSSEAYSRWYSESEYVGVVRTGKMYAAKVTTAVQLQGFLTIGLSNNLMLSSSLQCRHLRAGQMNFKAWRFFRQSAFWHCCVCLNVQIGLFQPTGVSCVSQKGKLCSPLYKVHTVENCSHLISCCYLKKCVA